jgi:hypothetical protein
VRREGSAAITGCPPQALSVAAVCGGSCPRRHGQNRSRCGAAGSATVSRGFVWGSAARHGVNEPARAGRSIIRVVNVAVRGPARTRVRVSDARRARIEDRQNPPQAGERDAGENRRKGPARRSATLDRSTRSHACMPSVCPSVQNQPKNSTVPPAAGSAARALPPRGCGVSLLACARCAAPPERRDAQVSANSSRLSQKWPGPAGPAAAVPRVRCRACMLMVALPTLGLRARTLPKVKRLARCVSAPSTLRRMRRGVAQL